jgi:hypothetical protein
MPCSTANIVSPLLDRPLQKPVRPALPDRAEHVVDPANRGVIAAGGHRGVVDLRRERGQLLRRGPGARGDPAVGCAAHQRKGAPPAHAQPDAQIVRGLWAGLHAGEPVVPAVEPHGPLVEPHQPDDVDRLAEGVDRLAG